MTPVWEIVRTGALPGDDGQLLLIDRGRGGRGAYRLHRSRPS